jgi:thiamine biosynthesis lipoprotein
MCQEHTVARLRPALGTLVSIEATAPNEALAERAVAAGFGAIRAIESRLHPTRPGSDLARLNHAGPGRRLPVHPSTATLLRLCRELHRDSCGYFDPALPGRGSVMHWLPAGLGAVIVKRRACVDLGGIAKGYAVDLAVEAMRRAGAINGLVNAGGDLRVFGARAWPIWLRSSSGAVSELLLRDCALAASDPAALDRPLEHRGHYAGRKHGARTRFAAVAVLAPSAAVADALTKVLMQAAPARAAAMLALYHARAAGPSWFLRSAGAEN